MGSKFKKDEELKTEVKQLSNDFPELFERNGRIKNYDVKINLKSDEKLHSKKQGEFQYNCKMH